jgi:hypothetical protein
MARRSDPDVVRHFQGSGVRGERGCRAGESSSPSTPCVPRSTWIVFAADGQRVRRRSTALPSPGINELAADGDRSRGAGCSISSPGGIAPDGQEDRSPPPAPSKRSAGDLDLLCEIIDFPGQEDRIRGPEASNQGSERIDLPAPGSVVGHQRTRLSSAANTILPGTRSDVHRRRSRSCCAGP